ncbi:MAG TPA: diguanylate cyclase [Abditibacteriaceae bacterium]
MAKHTSPDGSEMASRMCARVLLVLERSPDSSTYTASPLPAAGTSTSASVSIGLPAPDDAFFVTDDSAQSGGDASYPQAYSNGTYASELPPADLGVIADLSRESNARDVAPSADDTAGAPTHPLISVLAAAGHTIAWTTRADWMLDTQGALELNHPHVVLVESLTPGEETSTLCRDLRHSEMGRDAGIAVILAPPRRNDAARAAVMDELLDSGSDDFLAANATDADILTRVRLLAELARTRRELERAREQLRTQMQTDDQTRLLNRRFFFQAAHRECSRARRYNSQLSCLMIEVDHFKRLAAITGYDCGEAMLRAVALVLRDLTRDSDIVARFDEDKFAVLLPETTIEGATRLREKVQQAVTALEFQWHHSPIPLTVSGGEANRNREIRDAEEAAHRLDLEGGEEAEHVEGEPLSTREELAELLAAADAALFVARRGVRFPTLVGEFAPEKATHSTDIDDDISQLPSMA